MGCEGLVCISGPFIDTPLGQITPHTPKDVQLELSRGWMPDFPPLQHIPEWHCFGGSHYHYNRGCINAGQAAAVPDLGWLSCCPQVWNSSGSAQSGLVF
ncbi:hypothetical protein VTK56DRAFT_3153 [Thermocarpiscus australiensis]